MTVGEYKTKLRNALEAYYKMDVCERSLNYIIAIHNCLKAISDAEEGELNSAEMKAWNAAMVNEDGSIGGHWSISDTSPLMRDLEINVSSITPEIWNTTMNMMYSDYCGVARRYGVDIPEFYGSLAKAFLLDKDGPKPTKKLAEYYEHIVV